MVEEQMIDKNISFIPDVKIKPSDIANEKKLVWKLEKTTQNMPKNEASLFAGLEWIEKNGEYFNGIDFSKHISDITYEDSKGWQSLISGKYECELSKINDNTYNMRVNVKSDEFEELEIKIDEDINI